MIILIMKNGNENVNAENTKITFPKIPSAFTIPVCLYGNRW